MDTSHPTAVLLVMVEQVLPMKALPRLNHNHTNMLSASANETHTLKLKEFFFLQFVSLSGLYQIMNKQLIHK